MDNICNPLVNNVYLSLKYRVQWNLDNYKTPDVYMGSLLYVRVFILRLKCAALPK
jgi:hypothetical protein